MFIMFSFIDFKYGRSKIPVIIGIYNCAPTLQEALDSLYAQTYQDFEIMLCNHGSMGCEAQTETFMEIADRRAIGEYRRENIN